MHHTQESGLNIFHFDDGACKTKFILTSIDQLTKVKCIFSMFFEILRMFDMVANRNQIQKQKQNKNKNQ